MKPLSEFYPFLFMNVDSIKEDTKYENITPFLEYLTNKKL